jgi:cytochrome P450
VFDPSRFLGENPQLDPHEYTFGYGRRRCPGVRLADDALFMACARVLATFEISEAVNLNGEKVVMSSDYATGLVTL